MRHLLKVSGIGAAIAFAAFRRSGDRRADALFRGHVGAASDGRVKGASIGRLPDTHLLLSDPAKSVSLTPHGFEKSCRRSLVTRTMRMSGRAGIVTSSK
jgi:hypothetical protein